uniref:Ovule protein n=1 Tax=Schistosoma mansoni TaxID=6183 RepID=A0A5K4F9X2_SCHMA
MLRDDIMSSNRYPYIQFGDTMIQSKQSDQESCKLANNEQNSVLVFDNNRKSSNLSRFILFDDVTPYHFPYFTGICITQSWHST